MSDLKKCPFCGGEAALMEVEAHTHAIAAFMPDYEGGAFIECTGCTAAMSGRTTEDVTDRWNQRAPGWIKCSERMPYFDAPCLVWNGDMIFRASWVSDNIWVDDETDRKYDETYQAITHWMPLPEVPVEDEG